MFVKVQKMTKTEWEKTNVDDCINIDNSASYQLFCHPDRQTYIYWIDANIYTRKTTTYQYRNTTAGLSSDTHESNQTSSDAKTNWNWNRQRHNRSKNKRKQIRQHQQMENRLTFFNVSEINLCSSQKDIVHKIKCTFIQKKSSKPDQHAHTHNSCTEGRRMHEREDIAGTKHEKKVDERME
jgi:hypothetical protein